MLSRRSSPGSSSTSKIRPRVCSWAIGLLWIGTTFTFPYRSFNVRYRVQFGAGLVERGLQSLRVLVAALRRRGLNGPLQPGCFGIQNQPLFHVLQLDEREHA